MKITRRFIILTLLFFVLNIKAQVERCATDHVIQNQISFSELNEIRQEKREQIVKWLRKSQEAVHSRKLITVPVVVHIIWNTDDQNISDEQVYSQIEILNTDFRALNEEVPNIQKEFKDLVSDIEIEFCLANVDPEGNPTMGITRTETHVEGFALGGDILYNTALGGKTGWSPKDYINIWVCNSLGSLGFGTPPGESPGRKQGISIHYKSFGNIGSATDNAPYHLGRTGTHEMGHFFDLSHVFSIGCETDEDGIVDTPVSTRRYTGQCPNGSEFSCGNLDMYQNYMNYTDDACMGMFSKGQKEVMVAALNSLRPHLITSVKCRNTPGSVDEFEFQIIPNPTRNSIQLMTRSTYFPKGELKIFDAAGKILIEKSDWARRNVLSIEKLASGIYYLDFRSGKNRQILRFVKI